MEDYGYFDPIEAKKINKEATKVFLEHNKATENDIAELLHSYIPKYNLFKTEFYALPAGKIKLAKNHIIERQKILKQLADSMIVETCKYVAHSFYCTNFLNDIENKIDNLERSFRKGDLDKVIAGLNLKSNKIQINVSEKAGKIDIVMGGYKIQADKKEFAYNCLFKSFPKTHTSRAKAENFTNHYLKKAENIKASAFKTASLINDLRSNMEKLKREANSPAQKENFAKYMEKFNEFKEEFFEKAEYRVYCYLKKSHDSKMRKQVLKSLKTAQRAEMDKNPQNKELISANTLMKLLGDASENLINLNQQSNDKGME